LMLRLTPSTARRGPKSRETLSMPIAMAMSACRLFPDEQHALGRDLQDLPFENQRRRGSLLDEQRSLDNCGRWQLAAFVHRAGQPAKAAAEIDVPIAAQGRVHGTVLVADPGHGNDRPAQHG